MAAEPIREVFLVHHTHMDVGYTDLASEVRNQHLGHLDQALALCRDNPDRPPEERFFWTCESALLVRDYLEARPRRQGVALLDALRSGWIELQAFLTQPLTELASAQELVDNLAWACDLGRREGFPVVCGMIDDIGGYAGRLPSVMAQLGVPYLVAGVGAFQVHLPWADLPHLFRLRAADGETILVWNLGIDRRRAPQSMTQLAAVYGQAALYLTLPFRKALTGASGRGVEIDLAHDTGGLSARERFGELEARLQAEGYPHRDVLLQYGGDNQGPDHGLIDLLQAIRQRPDMPGLRLTTPRHFFEHMERTCGDRLPVLEGVITDPWNLRANPSPGTLRRHRQAQRLMAAVEARSALWEKAPPRHRNAALDAAALDLHLGSDHTCGLSEWGWEKAFSTSTGCRDAAFDRYRQSWQDKRHYAERALSLLSEADRVQRQRLAAERAAPGPRLAVWNDAAVPVGGECELYLGRGGAALASLHDESTGQPVAFQPLGGNRYLLVSPEVPAHGLRWLVPGFGPTATPTTLTPSPCHLRAGGLALDLDPSSGRVVSLRLLDSGQEILDPDAAIGLGEVACHDLVGVTYGAAQAGMSRDIARHRRPPRLDCITAGPDGPLFTSCITRWMIDGPRGPTRLERTLRLYHSGPRLDILVRVDKPENENKESLTLALPWAGRDGAFSFAQSIGSVEPSTQLLPGAMQDLFYCQDWGHLWAGAWGVTVVCPDAPLLQFGDRRFPEWRDQMPFAAGSNHMACLLYHNLLNTDCPIWQDVLETFRFSVLVHAGTAPSVGARHRLAAATRPLRADWLPGHPGGRRRRTPEPLRLDSDDLRVLAVRRRDSAIVLLLENTAAMAVAATLAVARTVTQARLTRLDGTAVPSGAASLRDAGRQVRLTLPPRALAQLHLV